MLSREHHSELNRPGVLPARFAELRQTYAADPAALQQIDVYDPASPYRPLIRAYRDALRAGDEAAEAAALDRLMAAYPDVGRVMTDGYTQRSRR